jgi:hypothetical protein
LGVVAMEKKKGGSKKLQAKFEHTKKLIDEAEKDGADLKLARALLDEVGPCLKRDDETEATKIFENIDLMVKHAKSKKKYAMMIFNSLPIIEKAKRAGGDVHASEALLAKAKELLDAGEFGDAHEQIKMARREAENAKHFMNAKAHIQRVTPLVEAARRKGVAVQDTMRIIIEAWNALKGGSYDVVTDLMKKATTLLEIAEEQKSYDISIADMEARVAAVATSGVDTKGMESLLKEAKRALEKKKYGDVRYNVNMIRREIEKIILQKEAGLTVRTIQQFVKEAKRAGISSDDLEGMLQKASLAIQSGDFPQVRAIELSAKQAVKNLRLFDTISVGDIGVIDREREEGFTALIQEELAGSKELVESARASGVDTSKIGELIKDAEAALSAGHLTMAFDTVRRVKKLIQDDRVGFQAVELSQRLEEIRTKLEEANAIGIDAPEAEELLSQAKALADENRTDDVADIVKKATLALDDAIKKGVEGRHPRLKVSVHYDGLEAQKWSRARVELTNMGNNTAKNVDVSFFGDVEVKDWQTIPKLLPGQSESREIEMKSFKPGKMPLDMTVSYQKSFDDTKFQLNDLKDVDVAESGVFLVEDAFLIYNNGILISKQTRRLREEVDGDLFSAMLTTISQFAKDSFNLAEKVALNRLEFGDNQVLIERGGTFFIAVTTLGEESVYMPFYISEIVREIEDKYGEVLKTWEGDMKQMAGIDEIVKKLLLIKNTDSGVPESRTSILTPVLDAIKSGVSIPDFERKITELLMSYEEELISGEIGETDGLLGRIKETVDGNLQGVDLRSIEEKKKDDLLKESMSNEVEGARGLIGSARDAGADVSQEEGLLRDLLALLDSEEYEKARKILAEIKDSLRVKEKSMVAEAFSRQLAELKSTLTIASKLGMDVSEIEGMTGEAEKLFTDGQRVEVDSELNNIKNKLGQKTKEFMANKYPRLQVEVEGAGGHEAGNWSTMDVVVNNKGNTPARNIDLNFAGDMEVKDFDPVDMIEPNSSKSIELSVKPVKSGKLQVEVSASYQRFFDETKYQLNDMKEVDVQTPGSYIVEDAFLIHNSGLLIVRETRRIKEDVDSDLFSAMLKGLTDFVRDAFKVSKKGGLDRMEFGGRKILIGRGKFVFLALTISGEESMYIPFFMAEVISEIEKKYSAALDNWDGEMKRLEGIEEMLQKIIFVKKSADSDIPVFDSSILTPVLGFVSGGEGDRARLADIEGKVAQIADIVEENGFEAAQKYLSEMEGIISRLTSLPSTVSTEGGGIDSETLKKRMYDIMIRSGRVDRDSALMDARLKNYMEVVGKVSDSVFRLRESSHISPGQTLARVAIKHPDYERWSEVMDNMRTLVLEQVNAVDIQVLRPDEVWSGLTPTVKINEERIRESYKHIAKQIINVLQYIPPDKLATNIKKGTFTIGVEGQQIYISGGMVSVAFSLPPGAFEGPLDSGSVYIDSRITEEVKSEISVNKLIEKVMAMRLEVGIEEGAMIEIQMIAGDALVERLEKVKDQIKSKCNAYDIIFPLDDPFGSGEYYVSEVELEGETCRIGIVQVELEG